MPRTVATADLRTLVNSIRPDGLSVRTVVRSESAPVRSTVRSDSQTVRTDANQDMKLRDLIKQTLSDLQRTQQYAAIEAGCTESDFSDAINGRHGRRFDAEWIWRQDDTFLRHLLDLMSKERGLTPETAIAQEVELLTALFGQLIKVILARVA